MTLSQKRAIYYKKQEAKYQRAIRLIERLGLTEKFEEFQRNYKGYYRNRVYSDFLRKEGLKYE